MTSPQYKVIAQTIDYLVAHHQEQPCLDVLADKAGYEVTHFQKLFKDHVGISPKRLVQYMNMRRARDLLVNGETTLETILQTGLSSTSRLHDLFIAIEGMTPGAVKSRGQGIAIYYGFFPTPLGEMLLAQTDKGLCYLGFVVDQQRSVPMNAMRAHWPMAQFVEDNDKVRHAGEQVMAIWRGTGDAAHKLKLDLYGTNFQLQVWQALLRIPCGHTVTYQDVARDVCTEKASRAVGNAVGKNPISLLIPCHRVIRASGIIDNYNWGSPRKKLILAMETNISCT